MFETLPYSQERVERALLASGVQKDTLEDYVERANNSEQYYAFDDKGNYDELAVNSLDSKYLANGESGPLYIWDRVARAIASTESPETQENWYDEFFSILKDFKFVPGGRIMHGAGREDVKRKPTLSNCYVVPIEEDSLEGIYRCLSESAMVFRSGGGVGTDLSTLRPKGSPVNATVDVSPGCTSFMNLLSESTNTVSQSGRRGALMLTLRVDHPDIEYFVDKKREDPTQIQYANLSVLITHEFMEAVSEGRDFDLRWNDQTYRTVPAQELWDKIITSAHSSAEPGIIFWDTMRDYHNLEYASPLSSTNPCGEQPLPPHTACNLGNLNLVSFVRDGQFDFSDLTTTTRTATRFLDNVIDYNHDRHAFDKIREAVAKDRRVGLGITGLAGAFALMNIQYDSEEAIQLTEKIMRTVRDTAYTESIELAKERGSFPVYDWEGLSQSKFIQSLPEEIQKGIIENGLRNGTLLTVAPVGTGSIVSQSGGSGIEPIFAVSYKRRVKQADGITFEEFDVTDGFIRKYFSTHEDLPPHIVTSHQIDPDFRVRLQGVIQNYTDASISSTINLSEDTLVETVADIYTAAYNEGLKGLTVYREGSRQGILQTKQTRKDLEKILAQPIVEERPDEVFGHTTKVKTALGSLFVTTNLAELDEHRVPYEVFSTVGRSGSMIKSFSEALSRAMSVGLKHGVPWQELANQLEDIKDTPIDDPRFGVISSVPEGAAIVMREYFGREGISQPILAEKIFPERPPRKLIKGTTDRRKTSSGSVFTTMNTAEKDGIRLPYETFTELGKGGSAAKSLAEALGRIVSTNLQYGVPVDVITEQMLGIADVPFGLGEDQVLSGPDAIGKSLKEYFIEELELGELSEEEKASGSLCPDCGSGLIHEQSCEKCTSCGYSRC